MISGPVTLSLVFSTLPVSTQKCDAPVLSPVGAANWSSFLFVAVNWQDRNVYWNENKPIVSLWEFLDISLGGKIKDSILVSAASQSYSKRLKLLFPNICPWTEHEQETIFRLKPELCQKTVLLHIWLICRVKTGNFLSFQSYRTDKWWLNVWPPWMEWCHCCSLLPPLPLLF